MGRHVRTIHQGAFPLNAVRSTPCHLRVLQARGISRNLPNINATISQLVAHWLHSTVFFVHAILYLREKYTIEIYNRKYQTKKNISTQTEDQHVERKLYPWFILRNKIEIVTLLS